MTHGIWDFILAALVGLVGTLCTVVGVLGRIVFTNLQTQVNGLADEVQGIQKDLSDFKLEVVKSRHR